MATITVSAEHLENHLNDNMTIESFDWAKYNTQSSIEFSVNQDLVIDDPNIVDILEFNEFMVEYDTLRISYNELLIKYNELINPKKNKWKFWK